MKEEFRSKENLIELLLFVRHNETKKPYDEMDHDLITACTELLLDLQNKNATLSPEEIEERVKNIPFIETIDTKAVKTKSKINKKRILLIAAIISILIAILSIASIGSDWNMFDILIDKFGRVSGAPSGVEFYENGNSYWIEGKSTTYASIEEWSDNEKSDILLPTKFPDSLTLKGISVGTEGNFKQTIFSFNEGVSYLVTENKALPQAVIDTALPSTIGDTTIYIEDLPHLNAYQVHFSNNGDYYCIVTNDKQHILEILENLEVYL